MATFGGGRTLISILQHYKTYKNISLLSAKASNHVLTHDEHSRKGITYTLLLDRVTMLKGHFHYKSPVADPRKDVGGSLGKAVYATSPLGKKCLQKVFILFYIACI